jgi:Spy/CpxP family protein refolding chaperone
MKNLFPVVLIPIVLLSLLNCNKFSDDKEKHGEKNQMMEFQGGWGHMMGRNLDRMQKYCNLTNTQVESIKKINDSYKPQFDALKEKIVPKKKELRDILLGDNVDMAKVKTLLQDIAAIEVENRMLAILDGLEVEKVLTVEQRKLMREKKGGMKGPGRESND